MMMTDRRVQRMAAGLAFLVYAATAAEAAQTLGRHADWTSFAHAEQNGILCFVLSQPKDRLPKNAKRDSAYFYISTRPAAGVEAEVSVKLGYPLKHGSETTITVDTTAFRLFVQGERAFAGDPQDEKKLLDAMRKGKRMVVQATSERGTVTRDTYSLAGLSQALQTVAASCKP